MSKSGCTSGYAVLEAEQLNSFTGLWRLIEIEPEKYDPLFETK